MFIYIFALFLISYVTAQVSPPNPPFLPPDASYGSRPASGFSQPNPQWSTLLGNLLYFYEAQRSGALPPSNRVSWRNSSTLDDGKDVGLNLSGGYFDAGDFIKATFPLSASLSSICWGAIDYGAGYDLANQTAYLDEMLRWGLDWLIKAHPLNDTLYVLVGNTDVDNAYWGSDQGIPSFRPSYVINSTHPGTDAAAGTSAAFSACSLLYSGRGFGGSFPKPASLQNSSYANLLREHAEQLYTFATTTSQVTYQTSVKEVAASYGSTGFSDELTLAALLLSWVNNSTSLYQKAEDFYTQFKLGGQDGVFNWDSKTPGLAVLFAQIALSPSSVGENAGKWQAEAERYFDNIINMKSEGYMTKGGLLYYDGDSDDASINPALNAAMLLTRYSRIASTDEKRKTYLKFAQSQLDYALGKNPMFVPYVVGVHPNSPSNPHSAMASGGNDSSDIDTVPEKEAFTLYGAVIGGPDRFDRYFDIRSDWPESEVALDYNSPLLTLTAMHVIDDTNDPFYTSLEVGAYARVKPKGKPCDAAFPKGCYRSLSKGKLVAIVVATSVVGFILLLLLSWYMWALISSRGAKTKNTGS